MVSTKKASKAKAKTSKADAKTDEVQAAPELSSEEKAAKSARVQENGERCRDAFNERFEKEFGWPPFVDVRVEMLGKTVEKLDEPYVRTQESGYELDEDETTVLVQLIKGNGEFLDDFELLNNPTLYEVYAACHKLCGCECMEAIGELPQDPRSLLHIDDYACKYEDGYDEVADLRAVFTTTPLADF